MQPFPAFQLPLAAMAEVTLYVLLIVYVIYTVVMYYHWQNYSMNKAVTAQTYIAYFITTIPLLAILGLSVLAL